MAKPWKEVMSSAQYQSLPPDQQAAAQEQYFNEVVAPQAGDQADAARQQFFSAYPTAATQQQPATEQSPQEQSQPGIASQLGSAAAETGRGLLQAGVNIANVPASMADAVSSAASWAGQKLGLGDGTYQPAPRVTTQGLEQDFGVQPGTLTPQTTEGKIFAEALPYLTPAGVESAAARAPSLAGRVAEGAGRLLAENAVGSLASNSEQNNPEKLATDLATGVALGGVVKGAGDLIGAGYRAAKGVIAPEAQQAIRFAEQQGVPLHTTDLLQPQGKVGSLAQGAAESVPFVGTSGMRATQQEARSKLVQDFSGKFGDYDPAQIVSSLKSKSSGIRKAAGNRLESVKDQMSGVAINPQKAIDQIDTEISKLNKLGGVSDDATITKLQAYRDELAQSGANGPTRPLDMEQLSNLRTQFRQDVKGERTVMPGRSEAAVNRVYNAMTGDLHDSIGKTLGNETLNKFKQANAVYADEANRLQNTRLKNVIMKGDLTPEVVNNMLFSKNKSEVSNLYRSVGESGRAQMRNGIIGKAMEKSGGSPDQFLRQLNMLSNQTGIAFKGADAGYIKGLKNYLEATNRAGKAGVTTPTGQQTIPFILGMGTISNPVVAAAGGGYGALARMYESKPVRNAMLKLANTPKGSSAFERNVQEVMRHVNAIAQGTKAEATSQ